MNFNRLMSLFSNLLVPLVYDLVVDNSEPDTIFVDEPTDTQLNSNFAPLNLALSSCNCQPYRCTKVIFNGQSPASALTSQILQAYLDANAGLQTSDLSVIINYFNSSFSDNYK